MKKRNKRILFYLLAFFIPTVIMLVIAYCMHYAPFQDKNFLISDMRAQYLSLLSYFKQLFSGDASLFYSFSKGLGGGMFGTLAYYVLSPINLLVLFFDVGNLPTAMFLIYVMKLGLSGLFMYIFLKNKVGDKKWIALLFSIIYALMGYNINYYFNIIWFDAIYLLPLVLLGIEKLIEGKRPTLYLLTLFLSIFTNYYMGYMVCLFSLLYFFYRLFLRYRWKTDKQEIIKAMARFFLASFCAGILCAVIIVPTWLDLQNSTKFSEPYQFSFFLRHKNPFDIFSTTYIGAHHVENILNGNEMFLYIGLLSLPLLSFFFVNPNIGKKEKIASLIMIGLFLFSYFFHSINMIWHGFQKPNSFNYRYAFIVSFFLLLLASRSLIHIKEIKKKHYLIFGLFYIFLSIMMFCFHYVYLNPIMIWVSLGCMTLYLLILFMSNYIIMVRQRIIIIGSLFLLVGSELLFNGYLSLHSFDVMSKEEYNSFVNDVFPMVNQYKPKGNEFYRIEKNIRLSNNDSILVPYYGVDVFLSTVNKNVLQFMNNQGIIAYSNRIVFQKPLLIPYSLLGTKYMILRGVEEQTLKKVDQFSFSKLSAPFFNYEKMEVPVYENPNALSIGYMVSDKVLDYVEVFREKQNITPFEFQNTILNTMTSTNHSYFKPYSVVRKSDTTFEVTIDRDDPKLYIYIPYRTSFDYTVNVYVNDEKMVIYGLESLGIQDIKNKYADEVITIRLEYEESKEGSEVGPRNLFPYLYSFDFAQYEKDIETLKEHQFILEEKTLTGLKGRVNVSEDKPILFFSIPQEEGWDVLVDGKKEQSIAVFDTFIGIELEPGEHEVVLQYRTKGLLEGIMISLIGLIMSICFLLFHHKIVHVFASIYMKYQEIIHYLIVGVLTTFVSLITYALFRQICHFDYITSSILSWILSVIFAFVTNKIFVFQSKVKDKKGVLKETLAFFQYRLLSLGIDLCSMWLLVQLLSMNDMIAKIVVQFIIVVLNYVFSKVFIFKKKNVKN